MPLDYHLERKVILSEDSEHKSLYSWFLYEPNGDDGKKFGGEQIPWAWNIWFRLSKIMLVSSLLTENYPKPKEGESNIKDRASISAKMIPSERHPYEPSFSMFGTARRITDFDLSIYPIKDDEEERCIAWGSPSYTMEIDFRDETVGDVISFMIFVRAALFGNLAQQIKDKCLDVGTFRVSGVQGFYSNWSPSITTSHIKVLCGGTEHAVEMPAGCSIEPPRIGSVGEFDLRLISETEFPPLKDDNEDEEDTDEIEPAQPNTGPQFQLLPVSDPAAVALLRSVRLAAWVIAAGLAIIVLKLVF